LFCLKTNLFFLEELVNTTKRLQSLGLFVGHILKNQLFLIAVQT